MKEPTNKDFDKNITIEKGKMRKDTIQLVAGEIYDKMIKLFNDTRKKFKIEHKITVEPQYKSFNLDDNGNLTFKYEDKGKNKFIKFGNINDRLISPSGIRRLGVNRLRLMGFSGITYKDVEPGEYKDPAVVKFGKLDDNLNKMSKEIESSSTTDVEAIELIEIT